MISTFSYYTEFSIAEMARLLLVPIAVLVYFFSTSSKEAKDTHEEMQNNSSPQKKQRWDSSGPEAMQLFRDCYFRKYKKATKVKTIHQDTDRMYSQYNEQSFRNHLKKAWDRVDFYCMLDEALKKNTTPFTSCCEKQLFAIITPTRKLHQNQDLVISLFASGAGLFLDDA
jgi:hypothetical protein